MRRFTICVLALMAGFAGAQDTYSVDTAGGPLTLIDELADAFGRYSAASGVRLPQEASRADVHFSYADIEILGPDTVTLTVQRPGEQPGLEILINPELYRDWPAALVHEAGLVLGLAPADAGVMRPLLGADGVDTPQQDELDRLAGLADAVPGDLTGDGLVDFLDLLELSRNFGQRGVNLPGDLDSDGTVTMDDLRLLRENYVFTEPAERSAASQPAAEDSTDAVPDPAAGQEDQAETGVEELQQPDVQPEPDVSPP